jgi:hypothetical protein
VIIGLNGKKRAGKNTFANALGGTHLAFGDALKDMALAINPTIGDGYGSTDLASLVGGLGWEQAKEFSDVRRFLQRLGTEGIRNFIGKDAWVQILEPKYQFTHANDLVVITDVRFDNEAASITDAGGWIVEIVRPELEETDSHASENGIDRSFIDFTVTNNILSELPLEVEHLLQKIGQHTPK